MNSNDRNVRIILQQKALENTQVSYESTQIKPNSETKAK